MPTYETGYYYTVSNYELIKDTLGSGNIQVETTDAVDENGWTTINYEWGDEKTKLVNYKHRIKYEIRVYKTSQATHGSNPVGILNANDGVKVVVLQSWVNSVADYATVPQTSILNNYIRQKSENNGTVFYFYVDGKGAGVITPKIKVTLEVGSEENDFSPEPLEVGPLSNKKMLTLNFTKASTQPKIPPLLKQLTGADRARWNACTKEWVGLLVVPVGSSGNVDTTLVYFNQRGEEIRRKYLGRESLTATGPNTYFGDGQEALLEAVRAVCGGETGTPDIGEPQTPPDADKIRYNPPNHFVTRSVSHGERTREEIVKGRIITNVTDVNTALANRNNRLGRIYQSEDGAKALNDPINGQMNYWGFRFSYNPQSIEYGTTVDTSIDWMLNSRDVANLLGGNTSVSVKLYLNRIADMTELKSARVGGDFSKAYPRALSKEEIEGILYRGTEYDLEFLYRVLNGDPSKTSLLSYDGKSSDFGYITGTPCWFHLHNNMRYYGSMASLQVSHAMFTQEMVPMLSTVDVTFVRYPSLDFASPAQQREAILNSAKTTAGTGEEAKKP